MSATNTKVACRGSANGALPGATGATQAGYTPRESFLNTCVPLASTLLNYFTADLAGSGSSGNGSAGNGSTANGSGSTYADYGASVVLSWALTHPKDAADLLSFTIERSVDQVHFETLATLPATENALSYQYTDPSPVQGTVLYRLSWLDKNGQRSYSRVLAVTGVEDPIFGSVRLFPDPADDQLSVEIFGRTNGTARLILCDAQGRQIGAYPFGLRVGTSLLKLPVHGLAPGAYFLVVQFNGRRQVKSFVKKN